MFVLYCDVLRGVGVLFCEASTMLQCVLCCAALSCAVLCCVGVVVCEVSIVLYCIDLSCVVFRCVDEYEHAISSMLCARACRSRPAGWVGVDVILTFASSAFERERDAISSTVSLGTCRGMHVPVRRANGP